MRVALVNNFFPPPPGGSAHFTAALAEQLGALGHDVLVVTAANGEPAGRHRCGPYAVERIPSWSLPPTRLALGYRLPFCFSPRGVRRCISVLEDFSPEIVHENSQILDLSLIASFWSARRDVPVVITLHTALVHYEKLPSLALGLIDRAVARPFLRAARAHIVAPDRFMHRYVERRYGLVPPDAVRYIPIGVDVAGLLAGSGARARSELGIGDRPLLLSLGHVTRLRDRLPLVEALPAVLAEMPDVAVVVAGRIYDDRFLRRAAELDVASALLVLGEIPKAQVADLVAAADAGCHELTGIGFGTASLELMGAGVPCVAVVREDNFPGVPLRDREHVLMVPPHNPEAIAQALLVLLERGPTWSRMRTGGRQLVADHFAMERVAEQYVSLYGWLLQRSTGRGQPALAPAAGELN